MIVCELEIFDILFKGICYLSALLKLIHTKVSIAIVCMSKDREIRLIVANVFEIGHASSVHHNIDWHALINLIQGDVTSSNPYIELNLLKSEDANVECAVGRELLNGIVWLNQKLISQILLR